MSKRSEGGMPRWGCVIAAAGSSTRLGGSVPKQFRELAGRRVVDWSVHRALSLSAVEEVVLVVPEGWMNRLPDLKGLDRLVMTVGGASRQESVRRGLKRLKRATHVLVHDAARPLGSGDLWSRVMERCLETGAAIPVIDVDDTVKTVSGDGDTVAGTVDRSALRLAQTPQAFSVPLLERALAGNRSGLTDESSALEKAGTDVSVVRGERANFKITVEGDMDRAASSLSRSGARRRVTGIGIDFHPFEEGRRLFLGGCEFESDAGLAGHSDGDVLLHAISDAVLSAARLGDIGTVYPPDDEAWRDASSSDLLSGIVSMLGDHGWLVDRVDATVIGERPSISSSRERIIARIAGTCLVPATSVWVKGTTGNGLGFAGRGEGLAAVALAEIVGSPDPGSGR